MDSEDLILLLQLFGIDFATRALGDKSFLLLVPVQALRIVYVGPQVTGYSVLQSGISRCIALPASLRSALVGHSRYRSEAGSAPL